MISTVFHLINAKCDDQLGVVIVETVIHLCTPPSRNLNFTYCTLHLPSNFCLAFPFSVPSISLLLCFYFLLLSHTKLPRLILNPRSPLPSSPKCWDYRCVPSHPPLLLLLLLLQYLRVKPRPRTNQANVPPFSYIFSPIYYF